ncbi:MAG: hypothetical protein H3Z53_02615 [archaeon]|nr:hypothetical protein [archaeon]MCP8313253.1 hypothetical protein [archaeon]MCP8317868.1 hypothetical protein [archaeon]MCP8319933.1 hypothetical protein [archaeon]
MKMEITKRVIDRLPSFYGAWNEDSLFFRIFDAFGKRFDEAQKDSFRTMRAHWVDTAVRGDLDKLGAIYNMKRKLGEKDSDYQRRLKVAIYEYKGGGTVSAIISLTKTLLGMREEETLELLENPPALVSFEYKLKSGDTWTLRSNSLQDATPTISFYVEAGNALFDTAKFDESTFPLEVRNPMITNLETKESIDFKGTISGGQKLVISKEKAMLDGIDVTDLISPMTIPLILRKGSKWQYNEAVKEKIGVFDKAIFDESLFETAVAMVRISFEWTAYQTATFELKVPRESLVRSGVSIEDLKGFIDHIKATGVRGVLTILD